MVACQPLLRLDISIFCRRWANSGFLFKMAASNNSGFWETYSKKVFVMVRLKVIYLSEPTNFNYLTILDIKIIFSS